MKSRLREFKLLAQGHIVMETEKKLSNSACFSQELPHPASCRPTRRQKESCIYCLIGPEWWSLSWGRVRSRPFSVTLSEPGFNSMWTENFQMFKLDLEKAGEPEIKLSTSIGSWKKQESSRKASASFTTLKPFMVWITRNCGKLLKRWEYQTTWPASWETYMQVRKQQLELDMEQQTGSREEKEYIKAVYSHLII